MLVPSAPITVQFYPVVNVYLEVSRFVLIQSPIHPYSSLHMYADYADVCKCPHGIPFTNGHFKLTIGINDRNSLTITVTDLIDRGIGGILMRRSMNLRQ